MTLQLSHAGFVTNPSWSVSVWPLAWVCLSASRGSSRALMMGLIGGVIRSQINLGPPSPRETSCLLARHPASGAGCAPHLPSFTFLNYMPLCWHTLQLCFVFRWLLCIVSLINLFFAFDLHRNGLLHLYWGGLEPGSHDNSKNLRLFYQLYPFMAKWLITWWKRAPPTVSWQMYCAWKMPAINPGSAKTESN